jgi:hypothetical protein
MFGGADPYTRAFAAKLARKFGWSDEFAYLAIREYKKFVFLGVVSHYPVTPSKVIDSVWHEHIHFTRGYREFCADVLRQHFDHSPELIPFDEQTNVFSAQYQKTLEYYEYEFGTVPPKEIWGSPKFNPKEVSKKIGKPARKEVESRYKNSSDSDTPLYTLFNTPADAPLAPIPVNFEGGGGSMGGGGATDTWSPSPSHDAHTSTPSCSSSNGDAGATGCSSSGCSGGCGGS